MPVITRSSRKRDVRPRIEDPTPKVDSGRNGRTRSCVRSTKTLNQKLVSQTLENVEPPTKRRTRTNKRGLGLPPTGVSVHAQQQNPNPVKSKDVEGVEDNEKNSTFTISEEAEEKDVVSTPGYVSARTRTYSEFRRSKLRRKLTQCDKIQAKLSSNASWSSLTEYNGSSPGGKDVQESVLSVDKPDDCTDVSWTKKNGTAADTPGDSCVMTQNHEQQDQDKYTQLVDAMKQLQNSFLRAQQNAERNITAFDDVVQSLKSSLDMEQQKNRMLHEELIAKKETVQKMRKDTQSLLKQINSIEQQRVQDDLKEQGKEKSAPVDTILTEEFKEAQRVIAEQKSIISLYSKLTGISLCHDMTSADAERLDRFLCTCFPTEDNKNGLSFGLTLDKAFEDIEYIPKLQSPGSENLLFRLPDYLQETIFFENSQGPKFLARFLNSLEALH